MDAAKLSDILIEAKAILPMHEFVCHAIKRASVGSALQKTKLTRWVMSMIAPYGTYGTWLRTHHRQFYDVVEPLDDTLYKGRQQWLDWMIAYLKKRGE